MDHVFDSFDELKQTGDRQWSAHCPAHEDRRASLSLSLGDDDRLLLYCHAGCSPVEVCKAAGLKLTDLFPQNGTRRGTVTNRYDYTDVDGNLLFQVERTDQKEFRQRQPDASGGWKYSIKGVPRVLYRLPEIVANQDATVFVVEGEKDADNLASLGLVATCNPGGAGKWQHLADDSYLAGRNVVIIRDRDQPGEKHATDVARRLYGRAAEIRIIDPPEGHKDVSDWIEARDSLTPEQFREVLDEAAASVEPYQPPVAEKQTPTATPPKVSSDGTVPLGQRDPESGRLVLSPRRTLPTAKAFVDTFYSHPEGQTLYSYAGMLLAWRGNRYVEAENEYVKQQLQPWLHNAMRYVHNRRTDEMELVDFESNPATVNAALESIRTYVHLSAATPIPSWLGGREPFPARELLPCRSANLHIPTSRLLSATPALFTTNALEFDYDAQAAKPSRWEAFLSEVWGDDQESIQLLQEWFGYCLTLDTSLQKMLLLVGPKRSGKGTIARVLAQLVGTGNVCGPTVSSLAGLFGLQPLIGKSLAIVSDARFSGENIGAVVERLLCISGEDTLTIDRKYLGAVTMKLPTRLTFLSNELPRLKDSSGALAGRFLILRFSKSFFGREDRDLTQKLFQELPGILLWALEGWRRLQQRGRFAVPESSQEAVSQIEDLLSPVAAFVRAHCDVGPDLRVDVNDLYQAWRDWCANEGWSTTQTKALFGRDLSAALPEVVKRRHRQRGAFYEGVSLRCEVEFE